MGMRYVFKGNETVGAALRRALEVSGWTETDDLEGADAAFTYFTSLSALEDAYFDGEGLIQRMKEDALLVDLSPATPGFARECAAIAEVNGLHPIEAPLIVASFEDDDPFADAANLACFVAGEEDDVERARALLEPLAATVTPMGTSGSAQLARAAYTLQVTAQIVSAIEAEALFAATQRLVTSAGHLTGAVGAVGAAVPQAACVLARIVEERFDGAYTVEMFLAEVAAAMSAADDVDLILPQAESVVHLIELLVVVGGPERGLASLALLYREEAEGARRGLDWSRAERLYASKGHEHAHEHDYGHENGRSFEDDDRDGEAYASELFDDDAVGMYEDYDYDYVYDDEEDDDDPEHYPGFGRFSSN